MLRNFTKIPTTQIEGLVASIGVTPRNWDLVVCSDLVLGVTVGNLERPTVIVAFMTPEQFMKSLKHELVHLEHFLQGMSAEQSDALHHDEHQKELQADVAEARRNGVDKRG